MEIGFCPICGDVKELTKDHLPPKKIFIKPRPHNLITIKTCFECNNGASAYDEAFKIMLSFILGGNDAQTQPLFDSALRSVKHNRRIARGFKSNMTDAYLTSQAGIIIEKGYLVKFDAEITKAFEEVVKRITKGMYYYHYQNFIGKNTVFTIRLHKKMTPEMLEIIKILVINRIGNGQFSYGYTSAQEGGVKISLWLYEFHQKYWISCSTRTILEDGQPSAVG